MRQTNITNTVQELMRLLIALQCMFNMPESFIPYTAGPWLMRFSVVRFSLVRSLKKIQKNLAYADFHQSPSLVRKIFSKNPKKFGICWFSSKSFTCAENKHDTNQNKHVPNQNKHKPNHNKHEEKGNFP